MSWLFNALPSIPGWSSAPTTPVDGEKDAKDTKAKAVHDDAADADAVEEDVTTSGTTDSSVSSPSASSRSSPSPTSDDTTPVAATPIPAVAIPDTSAAPTFALAPPSPRLREATPPSDLNIAILPDPIPLGNMAPPLSTTTRPAFGIKAGGGLAPPPSPLANGGPVPARQLAVPTPPPAARRDPTVQPSATGLMPTRKKGRGQVALAPGCSALDWARLTKSGANLSGTHGPMRVTMDELKKHRSKDDAWSAFNGVVYNITPYLRFHPGGEEELMRVAGRDGTKLFMLTHSWVNLEHLLRECMVGMLVRG